MYLVFYFERKILPKHSFQKYTSMSFPNHEIQLHVATLHDIKYQFEVYRWEHLPVNITLFVPKRLNNPRSTLYNTGSFIIES